MGLEATWSLVDIPVDARDAAQAAARREGLSVGEWLTKRILRRFSELNVREQEDSFLMLRNHVAELAERLDRFQGQSYAEPMREALKKLHQGLTRLNDELVRTAGHSAIQVSQLSSSLETLSGRVNELRAHDVENRGAFERRMTQLQEFVEGMNLRHAAETHAVASRMDSLGETLAESRGLMASDRNAVERLEDSLAKADTRYGSAFRALHEKFGSLSDKVDHVGAATSEASAALDQRIASLQLQFGKLDTHSAEEKQLTAVRLEKLHCKIDDLQADVTGMCGALDRRVLLAQQALQSLDVRHSEMSHSLTRGVESVAAQLDMVRSESARSAADLENRIATLEGAAKGEAPAEMAMPGRLIAIENRLSELANRTEAAESTVLAVLPKTEAIEARLEQLDLKFKNEVETQQQTIEQLKAGVVEQTLGALGEKLEAESRKQQAAIAELKHDLLGELSHAFDHRAEAEERKQQDAIAQLQSAFATALHSLGETFESEARKQQEAIAELRTSLLSAPQPFAMPANIDEAHAADAEKSPVQAASPAVQEISAVHTQPTETAVPSPAACAPEQHEEPVLELMALAEQPVAADEHMEPVQQAGLEPPPFAGPEDMHHPAEMPVAGDTFVPASVLARTSVADSRIPAASYLSAARQSLQAAATRNEPENTGKDIFGLRFLRSLSLTARQKGHATSYALIAAIVLVAILAIVVGAVELMSRSEPFTGPHLSRIAKPAKLPLAIVPHTAGKRASSPSRQDRIGALANGGNAQAQLFIGLSELAKEHSTAAAKWLERSAIQGVPVAEYHLATLYASGRGVAADKGKAFRWYLAAAQAGNRKAMSNLAVAYAQGDGTPKNPQEAGRWFLKAAQLGLADAQFDLAILYERGLGVPQNLTDAYRWYVIAAKAGDKESKDRVDALSSQLAAEDRAAAETAASGFKPLQMNARANEPQ
ncbi:MAG TPA: hypothetical protein VHT03_11930 [Rhizomicrobium sp.]|nr:hypothetical protein [Rhizomicrobium sp.]